MSVPEVMCSNWAPYLTVEAVTPAGKLGKIIAGGRAGADDLPPTEL